MRFVKFTVLDKVERKVVDCFKHYSEAQEVADRLNAVDSDRYMVSHYAYKI